MSRLSWTDPAPLEVERPRLPWWTMLPRTLLLAASPVIVVVVLVMVVAFFARRVWRYPLFLIGVQASWLASEWVTRGGRRSGWPPRWLSGAGCGPACTTIP